MLVVTNNEGYPGIGQTAQRLAAGDSALDAIESGVRLVEADERVRTVGRGGRPNLVGAVELDAAVMDGDRLRTGAVGALSGYLHPISIARQVLRRLPHEILVGSGAARFAAEIGAERGENLVEEEARAWRRWFEDAVSAPERDRWESAPLIAHCRHAVDPETGCDTTVFLARDVHGSIASGVSTSGWAFKYPGRLGDGPIVGAGSYADSRYGACACTGAGEMTIRAGTSRAVVLYLKMGLDLEDAVHLAAEDLLELRGGLVDRVTIHAIDAAGGHEVVAVNAPSARTYWIWEDGDPEPREAVAKAVRSPGAVVL